MHLLTTLANTKEQNMTTQQKELMMFNPATDKRTQNILNGINLILKYQPDAEIQAWSDVGITCGTYSEWVIEITKMTKEDIEQLMEWGWYGHAGKWRCWTRMYGQR